MSELKNRRLFLVFVAGEKTERSIEKDELENIFNEFGEITEIIIPTPNSSFAFIEFASHKSAQDAIDARNYTTIFGSKIKLEFAKKKDRTYYYKTEYGGWNNETVINGASGGGDDKITPMSCVEGIKTPEGYVLVEKKQIMHHNNLLREIEREIGKAKSNINGDELLESVKKILKDNNYGRDGRTQNRENLVNKFEKMCKGSQLVGKLDKEKSKILNELKGVMPAKQKKLKESQDELRKKFEDGRLKIENSYKTELMKGFQNKIDLNSSLPVDRYVCDELIRSYRDCIETQLVPAMSTMYKDHCQKIDGALKSYVSNYTNFVTQELSSRNRLSPAVASKINNIKQRLDQLNSTNSAPYIQHTLDNVTRSVSTHIQQLENIRVQQIPVELSIPDKIDKAIADGKLHEALNMALSATNLDLVIDLCKRVPVEDMFRDTPDQFKLLSLISQLRHDLHLDSEIKSSYIQETIRALNISDPCIREHGPNQLNLLLNMIQESKPHMASSDYSRYFKNIVWAVDMMKRSL